MAPKAKLSDLKNKMPLEAYYAVSDVQSMLQTMTIALHEIDMTANTKFTDLVRLTDMALERMAHLEKMGLYERPEESTEN